MTRSELIENLYGRFSQLTNSDVEVSVQTVINTIVEALAANRRVEIRGFGSFSCSYRKPRIGRNPRSGVAVKVPAKLVPHFKAGKELRLRVDS